MEDEPDALLATLRTQVDGREVVRGTESRRVPLDPFADLWADAEDDLPNGLDFLLPRMIQFAQERADGLVRLLADKFSFCDALFGGHRMLLVGPQSPRAEP